MNDVTQLLCVMVSLAGGSHCLWLLRNSRKPAESTGELVRSLPTSARSVRRKSLCAGINRFCQIVLATTFLAVAASLLSILAYRALSPLWEEPLVDRQMRRSVETVVIEGSPPVLVDHDISQPGGPIVGIDCYGKSVLDDQVRRLLRQAPKLVWLNLAYTDITDEALCELSCAPGLRVLTLIRTRVGDVGIQHLARLRNLENLYLSGTNVTDGGLRYLADLKSLRKLYLNDTAVTDAGLEWLGSLDKLEVLDLNNTRVTEEGMNRLKSKRPGVEIFSKLETN